MKKKLLVCCTLGLLLPACKSNVPIAASTTPTPLVIQSDPVSTPFTVSYLAVSPGTPTPQDPVPVADEATMQLLLKAAESGNRAKYNQIANSGKVILLKGGSIVTVLGKKGDLVRVDLQTRDIKDKDVSSQTGWTSSRFVQSRTINP